MILRALYDYYNRLIESNEEKIALYGFSPAGIHFVLIIEENGKLVQVQDIRRVENGKTYPVNMIVPENGKRTSGIKPNFLWDNSGYVLGFTWNSKDNKVILSKKKFEAFKAFHNKLLGKKKINDTSLKAVVKFLNQWNPDKYKEIENYSEIGSGNITFRLNGQQQYAFESEEAKNIWFRYREQNASDFEGTCLVTGEQDVKISRLHNSIKGVKGTSPSGASIVSFNLEAFTSYNKTQSYNAPISERAMFAYTTALNKLLSKGSKNKFVLGNTTVVFWTDKPSKMETIFGSIFNPVEDESLTEDIKNYFEALSQGKRLFEGVEANTKFYILGLSPNRSRIAIRFFFVDTIENIDRNLRTHFDDMRIVKQFENDPEIYTVGIWQLLKELAIQGKVENLSPLLEGELLKSIITGHSYPSALLSMVINRIRATDKRSKKSDSISYIRAALIKAILKRKNRLLKNNKMEVSMALDKENMNVPYRLGRLFAVLEKIQQDALGNTNTTITDRFYSTASSSPRTVFPQLIRLSQHHLAKIKSGIWYSSLMEEILEGVNEFPAFLDLENQGFFALGYYHQKRDLYTKNNKEESINE